MLLKGRNVNLDGPHFYILLHYKYLNYFINIQISVYNYEGGPCYRCLNPNPPPASAMPSCSDAGVLGPVPGLIGVMQAIEAIKVMSNVGTTMKQKLCVVDALDARFRVVRLRPRSEKCIVCGDEPSIKSLNDSDEFAEKHSVRGCSDTFISQRKRQEWEASGLCNEEDISVEVFADDRRNTPSLKLLDVRATVQYKICNLDNSYSVPLLDLKKMSLTEILEAIGESSDTDVNEVSPIYCLCRRGVDSITAAGILKRLGFKVYNIKGGLTQWSKKIDKEFPTY
eukprot:TRINITY_DN1678_c0_g1_i2.p1 TRINITY_DN1678_c0_g1~~TRINITY_DN1678_c0_g1_i2.p1  ORF type:complete len:282 (-),score=66.13 TRINITY_DN1678_c0_g1_i2:181-1026(-)